MKYEKKVSIIIPVYNAEKSIERCIDSVINQTYKNIEIVIIDDGSTDNTKAILKNYIDERVIIIYKQNEGVSIARNIGIENSTGEYITFLDADDWLEYDAIEKLVICKEDLKVDIVRYNYYLNYSKCKKIENIMKIKDEDINCRLNIDNKIINYFIEGSIEGYVWLLLIGRDIVSEFNKDIFFMEDFIFIINVMKKAKSICFFDKCLYHYYSNQNGASKSLDNIENKLNNIILVTNKANKILESYNDKYIKIDKFKLQQANLIYMTFAKMVDSMKINKIEIHKIEIENIIEFLDSVNLSQIGFQRMIGVTLIKKQKYKMLRRYIKLLKIIRKYNIN